MSETGLGGWIPPRAARLQAAEDARERQEARRAEAERADRAEQAHDAALSQYAAQAESRGEVISAIQLATGQGLGRTTADILADAQGAADREDARQASRDQREDVHYIGANEPTLHASRSDGWPGSSYEAARLLRRARDLHADLVAVRAKANYPATARAARAKSTAQATVGRSGQDSYRDITR